MLKINVISVGTLREPYFIAARDEYIKRLSPFCRIERTEIPEAHTSSSPSPAEITAAMAAEGRSILRLLSQKAYKIALCVEGRRFTSEAFASYLEELEVGGVSNIAFIIGGPWGLSQEVKSSCDLLLSVSDFTFTHRMMQPILYEIIYRSFCIRTGSKYHK